MGLVSKSYANLLKSFKPTKFRMTGGVWPVSSYYDTYIVLLFVKLSDLMLFCGKCLLICVILMEKYLYFERKVLLLCGKTTYMSYYKN